MTWHTTQILVQGIKLYFNMYYWKMKYVAWYQIVVMSTGGSNAGSERKNNPTG